MTTLTCTHHSGTLSWEINCFFTKEDPQTPVEISCIPDDDKYKNLPLILLEPIKIYVDQSICKVFKEFQNEFKSNNRIPLSSFKRDQIVVILKNLDTTNTKATQFLAALCIDPNSKGVLIQINPAYKG